MLIFRGLHSTGNKPVVLTIGNFDGVHLGHQALLKQLKLAGQLLGLSTAVLVFEPHPREFFTPQDAPVRLTSMREKLEYFSTLDVDRVYVCRFNSSFAQMSAVDFIHALHEKLAAKFVLIGDDFRFGNRRSGDFALMEKIGGQQGFKVEVMHRVSHDGIRISCRQTAVGGRQHFSGFSEAGKPIRSEPLSSRYSRIFTGRWERSRFCRKNLASYSQTEFINKDQLKN